MNIDSFFGESTEETNGKKKKKTKKAKKPKGEYPVPAEVFAFTSWFSLETNSESPQFAIKQQDIFSKFKEYWGDKPFNEEVILALCNFSVRDDIDNTLWVDRRQAFNSLNSKYQITDEQLEGFLKEPTLPLKSEKNDASSYSRSLLSDIWGDPEKKTSSETYDNMCKLCGLDWNYLETLSPSQLRQEFVKVLGISEDAELTSCFSFKGNKPEVAKFINIIDKQLPITSLNPEYKFEKVFKAMDKWMKKNKAKFVSPLWKQPWINVFLEEFQECTGISYHNPTINGQLVSKRLLGECSQMLTEAWKNIRASYTKVCNNLAEKLEKQRSLDEFKKKQKEKYQILVSSFCEDMKKEHDLDSYLFEVKQANGVKTLLEDFEESQKLGVSVQDLIKNISEEEGRVNPNFLNWLIDHKEDVAKFVFEEKPEEVEKQIVVVAKVIASEHKLSRLNMPRMTFPTKNRPTWVQFGSGGNFSDVQFVFQDIEKHYRYSKKHSNNKYCIGHSRGNNHKIARAIKTCW